MTRIPFRSVGVFTGLAVGCAALQGCTDAPAAVGSHAFKDDGFSAVNGLSAVNGFSAVNGLSAVNGFSAVNGLSSAAGLTSANGLSSANGLMTTPAGRKTITYLVKCALGAGDSLVKADQYGTNYTFAGGIGLCPEWKTGSVAGNVRCMEAISACLMAHINTAGVHVPLWLDSGVTSIGWGVDRVNYPMQEGTFFGDIMDTGNLSITGKPSVTAPVAYYCDGAGYPAGASGVVAGRLGANQAGAPYTNPYGGGTARCQDAAGAVGQYSNGIANSCPPGSNANPQAGCPDGYKSLTVGSAPWLYGITVWRNNTYTPKFDNGYIYRIAPLPANGAQSLDVYGGSTAVGATIQQWATWDGASQKFQLVQDGSAWRIAMSIDPSKCVDLVGSGSSTGNGTHLQIASCSPGDASQQWSVSPDVSTGAFVFKNVAAGRCLDENVSNTSSGTPMQIWDCSGGTNQKFSVQAY